MLFDRSLTLMQSKQILNNFLKKYLQIQNESFIIPTSIAKF